MLCLPRSISRFQSFMEVFSECEPILARESARGVLYLPLMHLISHSMDWNASCLHRQKLWFSQLLNQHATSWAVTSTAWRESMHRGGQSFQKSKGSINYICHRHHTKMNEFRDQPLFIRGGYFLGGGPKICSVPTGGGQFFYTGQQGAVFFAAYKRGARKNWRPSNTDRRPPSW